jgi:predicted DNA-binding protein
MSLKDGRRQINIRLEEELYDFLAIYSKKNYKTITAVVRELIANLYKEHHSLPLVVSENNLRRKMMDGYH